MNAVNRRAGSIQSARRIEFGRKQTAMELLNSFLAGMDAMRCEVAVMYEYETSLKWLVNSG